MKSDFAQILLQWFDLNERDLPWRRTRDPYSVWLSEIILQQTRVQQGTDYWHRFVQRFPDVASLAAASEDQVLRLWQGLGYYSRARNLHAAAQQVVAMGGFPHTAAALRQLKGVGDYTAAAIASIAFNEDVAAVDGNVLRVLSRYYGIDVPINTTEGHRTLTALAQSLLPHGQAGRYNQALMDFGALQCTPQAARCNDCPLLESCQAFRTGRVAELPVKQQRTHVKHRALAYIYIRCNGETAIHRRGPGDIWQGLYELLCLESSGDPSEVRDLLSASGILLPLTSHLLPLKMNVRHVLTHRILLADFYLLETSEKPSLPPDYIWIKETELDSYAVPRLIEKFLQDYR